MLRKLITAFLLSTFIVIGFSDALLHGEITYSSIMGMDINRVYFYTFHLLIIGCWLLYNRFLVGIGFICLGSFNSYFIEYMLLHNYFASIVIYIVFILDILIRRKIRWLIPFVIIGIIQGIAFQTPWLSYYLVGIMEFASLSIGTIFIVKHI